MLYENDTLHKVGMFIGEQIVKNITEGTWVP
jgi:hypothetical protein